jgi:hypothetical protein
MSIIGRRVQFVVQYDDNNEPIVEEGFVLDKYASSGSHVITETTNNYGNKVEHAPIAISSHNDYCIVSVGGRYEEATVRHILCGTITKVM